MSTPQPAGKPSREELRERFLGHAAAAFDLMFDAQYQDQLVTFEQREDRAGELGRDLITWLLQQHANADPAARPDATQAPTCPKCHRVACRVTTDDQPLQKRPVTTLYGEVTLHRQKWRCTTCRVVFFPPGRASAVGDGGIQPNSPA
jgi:hypothetical protein